MEVNEGQKDKINVKTSKEADDASMLMIERGWFKDAIDVYRTAVAYALASNLQPNEGPKNGGKSWNIGSLDPEGTLKKLLLLHGISERPYAISEQFAEVGILSMAARAKSGETISAILGG